MQEWMKRTHGIKLAYKITERKRNQITLCQAIEDHTQAHTLVITHTMAHPMVITHTMAHPMVITHTKAHLMVITHTLMIMVVIEAATILQHPM